MLHGPFSKILLQKLVTSILSLGDEDRSMKDVGSLMSVIGLLSRQLSSDNAHGTELQDWLIKICKEQAIGKTAWSCYFAWKYLPNAGPCFFYSFFVYSVLSWAV